MARNTEKLIRDYSDDFKNMVSRDVKRLASKEEQDFLFKNVDLWEIYLINLYTELNTALSINDSQYNFDGESGYDYESWKRKALYFKGHVQARLSEVKLLANERHREKHLKEETDKFKPHMDLLNQILVELQKFNEVKKP